MHLQCRYTHTVQIGRDSVHLRAGERIHTENSYKYNQAAFAATAAKAVPKLQRTWYDSRQFFSVHYLTVDASAVFDSYDPLQHHERPQPVLIPDLDIPTTRQ